MSAQAEISGITSREYKVGLDPSALPKDAEAAIGLIKERLDRVVEMNFKKPKHGEVQFFDTDDCTLTRNSMLLRARMKAGKAPHLTLKVRDHDILAVDAMPIDLVKPAPIDVEDDYGIGPDGKPRSNFSRSLSFDGNPPKTLPELGQNIRNLDEVISFPSNPSLQAGPLVAETVYASKKLQLADDRTVKIEVSLWRKAGDGTLAAGDVSFTLEAPFAYGALRAADKLLADLSDALGPLRGSSGEKALAVLPGTCR